jgi:hypothetical protein
MALRDCLKSAEDDDSVVPRETDSFYFGSSQLHTPARSWPRRCSNPFSDGFMGNKVNIFSDIGTEAHFSRMSLLGYR